LREKIQKNLCSKFFHTKNLKISPRKIFGYAPDQESSIVKFLRERVRPLERGLGFFFKQISISKEVRTLPVYTPALQKFLAKHPLAVSHNYS